jgi:hypothetical protein
MEDWKPPLSKLEQLIAVAVIAGLFWLIGIPPYAIR